jgi:chemotaxis signal transduction protein
MLVPVINFRYRLNLPTYPIRACDYFLIVDTPVRKLALVIDDVGEVIKASAQDLFPAPLVDGNHVSGIFRCDDGIILIYDLEALLSKQEESIVQELVEYVAGNQTAL